MPERLSNTRFSPFGKNSSLCVQSVLPVSKCAELFEHYTQCDVGNLGMFNNRTKVPVQTDLKEQQESVFADMEKKEKDKGVNTSMQFHIHYVDLRTAWCPKIEV